MTEYIRIYRDGVGWWARYREYNLQDAYNLCTECRANPTCENPAIINQLGEQLGKTLIVWECVGFLEPATPP
jgi:hypothetical protein